MSETTLRICVVYPAGTPIVLRTSVDWSRDLHPIEVSADGTRRKFELTTDPSQSLLYFKPIRCVDGDYTWAEGSNYLASNPCDLYPHFDGGLEGEISDHIALSTSRVVRVFTPPGYRENTLKRYPVLYVLDGANVFFPAESFSGEDWSIDQTVEKLNAVNLIDKLVVVALYSEPDKREHEYTQPGYEAFAKELVESVMPEVASRWRLLSGPKHTAVMGASLGGVAALFLALTQSSHIGMAACLSSTFGWRDDLRERIRNSPLPKTLLYLDAGFPSDNHRETREVYDALIARGLVPGRDALFLGFPGDTHNEVAWAHRAHLPIQFFFGRAFRR
jgi:predicted alpha/beta superfamily hydrolase